jgi:hypothetical protein
VEPRGSPNRSVVLRREGKPEIDVTEDVVTILDAVHHSMDWGSGFLEDHEEESARKLMRALGFTMDRTGLRATYQRPDAGKQGS